MADLRTNFKDDIYSGNRKYIMTQNEDGTVSFSDATNYEQRGDAFGANEVNSITGEVNKKADKTDIPASLPADGGDAATVNGHTVESDVPAGAKFTDTVYTHPATHPPSILSAGNLPTNVNAAPGTDYTTSRIRKAKFSTTVPASLENGEICFVYE